MPMLTGGQKPSRGGNGEERQGSSARRKAGADIGPACLHNTEKAPGVVRKGKSERCPLLTKTRDKFTSFLTPVYF